MSPSALNSSEMRGTAVATIVRSRATRKRARKLHSRISQNRKLLGLYGALPSLAAPGGGGGGGGGGCEGDNFSASLHSTCLPLPGCICLLPAEIESRESEAMAKKEGPAHGQRRPQLVGGLVLYTYSPSSKLKESRNPERKNHR
jgi:hypothetical protein